MLPFFYLRCVKQCGQLPEDLKKYLIFSLTFISVFHRILDFKQGWIFILALFYLYYFSAALK